MNSIQEENNFVNIEKIIIFAIVIIIGIVVRFVVFPYDLPIYQDGEVYFWYANDMSITGDFPRSQEFSFPNNLWPIFLSGFFTLLSSNNFIDYMTIQRIVTIGLSVATSVPIFFLCRRFVDDKYAIIGSALFIFEPRLIQSSINGVTEPLFLLLGTVSLVLFLTKRMIFIYSSFVVLALFVLTRYEGLVLILPLTIMFFWRFRKQGKNLIHLLVCLSIFFIIIFAVDEIRHQSINDPPKIFQHFENALIHYGSPEKIVGEVCHDVTDELCVEYEASENLLSSILTNATINLIKYYGWFTFPLFLIFIPYGIFKIFSKRNFEKNTMILYAAFMLLPAFYAFSRDFEDLRYFYFQVPFLCILGAISLEFFGKKIKKEKLLVVVIIPAIIVCGMVFYYDQISFDYELEREYFEISKKLNSEMKVINNIDPVDNYIRSAKIASLDEFPVLRESFELRSLHVIKIEGFDSLEKLLEHGIQNDLKYLIIDQDGDGVSYMAEVFENENDFPFLTKTYDSVSDGFKYHVKFFKINYDSVNKYYG